MWHNMAVKYFFAFYLTFAANHNNAKHFANRKSLDIFHCFWFRK